jgi:NifB/MoaA-like Fe-S oxidoreductase
MLNNRHAPDILPQIDRLAALGIRVHTQVVLSAGLNDAAVLDQTIAELAERYPAVQSLSVVPVGLTRFSRVAHVRRPSPSEAEQALRQIEAWQAQFRPRLGNVGFVYGSDELYLLAGREAVPAAVDYDGFPVLSNGVGMLRNMLDEWQRLLRQRAQRRPAAPPGRGVAWLTGQLAAPALERMAVAWQAYAGWRPQVIVVGNDFFGNQVSVSGLLAGIDLVQALRALPAEVEDVVLPRGAFGFDRQATLDGVTAEEVGAAHPGRVHLASTPRELLALVAGDGLRRSGRSLAPPAA